MAFFIFIQILIEISIMIRTCSVASDLGLHCLPMSHKKDTIGLYGLI